MENHQAEKLQPTIRLSKEKKTATLKLGTEQCELSVQELHELAKVVNSRINELIKKQRLADQNDPAVQLYWHNDFITRRVTLDADNYAKVNGISVDDAKIKLTEYYNSLWPLNLKTK